jgi:hypothetical protein
VLADARSLAFLTFAPSTLVLADSSLAFCFSAGTGHFARHEIKPPTDEKKTFHQCFMSPSLAPVPENGFFGKRTMAPVRGDQGVVNWRKPGKTGFWRPNVVSRSTYARMWGAGCALGGQNRLF